MNYGKFALRIIPNTNRIAYVTYEAFCNQDDPLVSELPEGKISDYRYIDGEFIYDPLPEPEPEPDPIEVLQSEVAELKSQNEMLTECLLEVSEEIYN